MKILNITTQKPLATGSGIYLTEVMRALAGMGHSQALVAGITSEDISSVLLPGNATFFPVLYETASLPIPVLGMSDSMPYPSTKYRDLTPDQKEALEQTFRNRILEAVRSLKPDLVICHHIYLLTALVRKWLPDLKIVGICHGSDLQQFIRVDKWRDEIREGIRNLDMIYALHEPQRVQIEELFHNPNVKVLGSAINTEIFHTDFGKNRNSLLPVDKTLVYAGKVSREKGVIDLVKCLELLPYDRREFGLVLVGGNENTGEMEEVERLTKQVGYPVLMTGRVSQPELAEIYRSGSAFVLPSYHEGLPLVIFEAMACGLPVICTELPGIRSWADANVPGNDILFVEPPKTDEHYRASEAQLRRFRKELSDKILMRMGKPGNELPDNYRVPDLTGLTWESLANRLLML